jgi:hypothetical protein
MSGIVPVKGDSSWYQTPSRVDGETARSRGSGELAVVSEKHDLAGMLGPQQGGRQMDRVQRFDWHGESPPSSPEHDPVDWNQIKFRQIPVGVLAQPRQFRPWRARNEAQAIQRPQELGDNQLR